MTRAHEDGQGVCGLLRVTRPVSLSPRNESASGGAPLPPRLPANFIKPLITSNLSRYYPPRPRKLARPLSRPVSAGKPLALEQNERAEENANVGNECADERARVYPLTRWNSRANDFSPRVPAPRSLLTYFGCPRRGLWVGAYAGCSAVYLARV